MENKSVAAMWVRKDESGKTKNVSFVTEMDLPAGQRLIGFKNDYKKTEKQPDYRFYLPLEQASQETPSLEAEVNIDAINKELDNASL